MTREKLSPAYWYWTLRFHIYERQEDRFVQEVVKRLGNHDVLYVHPESAGPATIEIRPIVEPTMNHTHAEARK
jgi:hypothetical protein